MKVYVAAAGVELAQAQSYIRRLQEAGIEITLDWTKDIAENSAKCRHCGEVLDKHARMHDTPRCTTIYTLRGQTFERCTDRDLSEADRFAFAKKDIEQGILPADIVWLLCPASGGVSCFIEFGYALGHGGSMRVFVSGDLRRSIFISLADERFEEHEKAFERIVKLRNATRATEANGDDGGKVDKIGPRGRDEEPWMR